MVRNWSSVIIQRRATTEGKPISVEEADNRAAEQAKLNKLKLEQRLKESQQDTEARMQLMQRRPIERESTQ